MRSFSSIAAFVAFLGTRPAAMHTAQREGEVAAGHELAEHAKAKLGEYQAAAGPFPAWAELADATKEQRKALGFTENDPLLRNGRLREAITSSADQEGVRIGVVSATVGDGSPRDPSRDIGVVARAMELGTARVPERPFVGPAMFQHGHKAADHIAHHVVAALAGSPKPRDRKA